MRTVVGGQRSHATPTFPVRESSPVMATLRSTALPRARDRSAVTTVTPALGPSFGVAPWRG